MLLPGKQPTTTDPVPAAAGPPFRPYALLICHAESMLCSEKTAVKFDMNRYPQQRKEKVGHEQILHVPYNNQSKKKMESRLFWSVLALYCIPVYVVVIYSQKSTVLLYKKRKEGKSEQVVEIRCK